MTKQIKCRDCKYLKASMARHRGSSSIYSCGMTKGECSPYKEISRVRGPEEIPTKTSPRWCPLKYEVEDNE